MNLYTFFICKQDGSATTFEVRELASDAPVGDYVDAVLREHACSYVSVWCGDRPVMTRSRSPLHTSAFEPANDRVAHS